MPLLLLTSVALLLSTAVFLYALNSPRKTIFQSPTVITIVAVAALSAGPVLGFRFTTRCGPYPKNTCINNLRQIDGAKEQWALEHEKEEGDLIIISEVDVYIKGGHLQCPSGGAYRYRKVGDVPLCSVKGHTIE